jgi:hypothetical protein
VLVIGFGICRLALREISNMQVDMIFMNNPSQFVNFMGFVARRVFFDNRCYILRERKEVVVVVVVSVVVVTFHRYWLWRM